MNPARSRSRPLVIFILLLWGPCFLLSVRAAVWPRGYSPLILTAAESPGGYPTLRGFWSFLPGAHSGLRIGDRLIRVGEQDLRGAGPVAFFVAVSDQARTQLELPVVFERAGERATAMLPLGSTGITRPVLPAALCFAFGAAFLLLRARPSPLVHAFAAAFLCSAFYFSGSFFGSRLETWATIVIHAVTMTITGPLQLRAFLLFPHGIPPRTRLARLLPWAFVVLGPLHMSRFGFPPAAELAVPLTVGGVLLMLAAILAVITRAFRQADPVARRQIKWFLLGVYWAIAPALAGAALAAWDARFTAVYVASLGALAFVPLALLVSLHRYDAFDVDRLISSTASYNFLLLVLVIVGIAAVPWIAELATARLGLSAWTGNLAVAGLLAAVILPGHRALRPFIERVFFPERWALDQGIDRLLVEVPRCRDPKELIQHVGTSLCALLQPEACVAYARDGDGYVPAFVEGRVVPSALDGRGPLLATVRRRRAPLALGQPSSRGAAGLDPFERAVLETLDAAVVLPISRGEDIPLLLCLGRKRSGDIFTPTDVRLLGVLAERISAELLHFDHTQLVQQARSMRDALRRYVPEGVADGLANGLDVEPGERQVTVLFVDLRGYTSYCEGRSPGEIFATVNRYTEAVSRVAHCHGGNVVEFNGDGLMLVFGAPQPLPEKERAAVRAAREILAAVNALEADRDPGARLMAGAGVASGPAFVGCIRSADRLVWSALGNTTNLAARLETLTRDLDVAVVIDAATQHAAGDVARDFELRRSVTIRGRREAVDVFALPRSQIAPAHAAARSESASPGEARA